MKCVPRLARGQTFKSARVKQKPKKTQTHSGYYLVYSRGMIQCTLRFQPANKGHELLNYSQRENLTINFEGIWECSIVSLRGKYWPINRHFSTVAETGFKLNEAAFEIRIINMTCRINQLLKLVCQYFDIRNGFFLKISIKGPSLLTSG